jgi:hypothetical protein
VVFPSIGFADAASRFKESSFSQRPSNTSVPPIGKVRPNLMKTNLILPILCLASILAAVTAGAAEPGFTPLFEGKTLRGWHALPGGNWEVKDGVIVGTSDKTEKRHGLLVSDKTYGDFSVRLKFKVLHGNSGFYFRSEKVDSAVAIHGFQAEVANDPTVGGLYETGGRAWVAKPDAALTKSIYKTADWNELIVTTEGRHVVVHLNGAKTVELTDDPGRLGGHLALQLHGGQDMEVMFKDIEIKALPAP